MPIFMVERRFADDLDASAEVADRINRINSEEGVRWLYSFLSTDKRKTYCLYEAPTPDAILRAAKRAGLPADAVMEMGSIVLPEGAEASLPTGPPRPLAADPASGNRVVQPAPGQRHRGGLGPVYRAGLEQNAAHVVSRRVLG